VQQKLMLLIIHSTNGSWFVACEDVLTDIRVKSCGCGLPAAITTRQSLHLTIWQQWKSTADTRLTYAPTAALKMSRLRQFRRVLHGKLHPMFMVPHLATRELSAGGHFTGEIAAAGGLHFLKT